MNLFKVLLLNVVQRYTFLHWVTLLSIGLLISSANADSNSERSSNSDSSCSANAMSCEDIDRLEAEICDTTSYFKQCQYRLKHAHFNDLQTYLRDRNLTVLGSNSQDRLFLMGDGKTIEFWLDNPTRRKVLIDAIVRFDQDRPVDLVTLSIKIFAVRDSSESGASFDPVRAVTSFVDSLDLSYNFANQKMTLDTSFSGIDVDKILKVGNNADVISEVLTIPLPQVAHDSSIAVSNQSSYFIDTGAVNAEKLKDGVVIKGQAYLPGGEENIVVIEDFSFEFGVPVYEVQNYKNITVQELRRNTIKQMRIQKGNYIPFFRSDLMHLATEKSKGALSFKNIRKNERSTIYGLIGAFDNGNDFSASKVEREGVNVSNRENGRKRISISEEMLNLAPIDPKRVCNSLEVDLIENQFGTLSFSIGFNPLLARKDNVDLVVKTRMELKRIGLFRPWKHEDFLTTEKLFTHDALVSDLPLDAFTEKKEIPFEILVEEQDKIFERRKESGDRNIKRFKCERKGFFYPQMDGGKIVLLDPK